MKTCLFKYTENFTTKKKNPLCVRWDVVLYISFCGSGTVRQEHFLKDSTSKLYTLVRLKKCISFLIVKKAIKVYISQLMTKPTIRLVRPAKNQSSLIACAFYSIRAIQGAMNVNPCHTGMMYKLICLCWSHMFYCRFCRAPTGPII